MDFIPTRARIHPLYGLHLTDSAGVTYRALTKTAFMVQGIVSLSPIDGAYCPYELFVPGTEENGYPDMTIHGTRNPLAVELMRRADEGRYPAAPDGKWVDMPIPTYLELTTRWV